MKTTYSIYENSLTLFYLLLHVNDLTMPCKNNNWSTAE